MERRALLLYLQSIRDLEVAKYSISELKHNKEIRFNSLVSSLPTPDYSVEEPISDSRIGITVALIAAIVMFWLIYLVTKMLFALSIFMTIFCTFVVIILNMEASYTQKRNVAKKRKNVKLEKHNDKLITSYQSDYLKWKKYCDEHEATINRNLNDLYGFNIIPKQFRSLESIIYIYDYMSSSQASLETTLYHTHIEDGIQRIKRAIQKMCNDISHQLYVQNVQNKTRHQQIMNSNQQMIQSLKSMSSSSAEALQYARLAADYSKTSAYLQTANYLRRNFFD